MAAGNSAKLDSYKYLRDAAWKEIGNATVDGAERKRHWKAWESHIAAHNLPRYLEGISDEDRTDALLTFAVAIRAGKYGLKHQVLVQSVRKALRHVSQAFVLARVPDPRRQYSVGKEFDRPIALLLKKFSNVDPPPKPKLAIPISTINTIADKYKFSVYHLAVADLIIIAFFYLLRVGEYTGATKKDRAKKRTVPLRTKDVTLWKDGVPIPHSSSLEQLLHADSATIKLENTKNGTKNATVHQYAFGGLICPVAAMARRVHQAHTIDPSGNANLGTTRNRKGKVTLVSSQDVNAAVKWGALNDGLFNRGYSPKQVSSHSLRAGGAMALKLAGTSDSLIKIMGRWSSDTFITYIHSQIGALSAGLSEAMAQQIIFHNIG